MNCAHFLILANITEEEVAKLVSDQVLFSHTESHWQRVSSQEAFMLFLDSKLNPAEPEERKDWIFVLDLASIHRAEEFRAKVPNHIHIVYIPARATSYCQPCDLAIPKDWKSVVAGAASESLAGTLVTGQNIKTALDFSLVHLKKRTVTWAEQATLAILGRLDLRKLAWKHASWESDEDFALLVAEVQAKHDASQLFISHADQPVAGKEYVSRTSKASSTWTKRRRRTKAAKIMFKGQLMLQQRLLAQHRSSIRRRCKAQGRGRPAPLPCLANVYGTRPKV